MASSAGQGSLVVSLNVTSTMKPLSLGVSVLVFPDSDAVADGFRPFHVYCDACIDGFGAVLEQEQPGGSVRPIAYISRATLDSERHWTRLDLEAGSTVWAIKRLGGYLWGTKCRIFERWHSSSRTPRLWETPWTSITPTRRTRGWRPRRTSGWRPRRTSGWRPRSLTVLRPHPPGCLERGPPSLRRTSRADVVAAERASKGAVTALEDAVRSASRDLESTSRAREVLQGARPNSTTKTRRAAEAGVSAESLPLADRRSEVWVWVLRSRISLTHVLVRGIGISRNFPSFCIYIRLIRVG